MQPLSTDSEVYAAAPSPPAPGQVEAIFERVKATIHERLRLPSATYRAQLNRHFTFRQARAIVDYLHRLGVSTLYASPYFRAGAESLHGYDIASHNELNPSIGSERELEELVRALREKGMRHILDMVPNHMGIGEEGNLWWRDVLENGRSSSCAHYFDIDWDPINTRLTNKVLLPVLGDQYGRVLESGELRLYFAAEEGRFFICYFERTLPVEPGSYLAVLEHGTERLAEELGPESEASLEYKSILTALSYLAPHWETGAERVAERNREKEVIKRRIAALCAAEPRLARQIEREVEEINGTPGDPRSFDALDAILERQPYRLSYWRVATEEINYRRFFDVNELAAVEVHRPEVFAATHGLVMKLLREDVLHGLRIDHVDGLRDPAGYFEMLQRAYFLEICRAEIGGKTEVESSAEGLLEPQSPLQGALLARYYAEHESDAQSILRRPLYVLVEKILSHGEKLPPEWAVYGTTGYEFTNAVNGLFVESSNRKAFDAIYSSVIGEHVKFDDLAYRSKQQIMRIALSSEITVLTNMLNHISERDRRYRDFTLNALRNAMREIIASFPVYRTYMTEESSEPDRRDQAIIESAVARAKKRNPAVDATIFDFIGEILLMREQAHLDEMTRRERVEFVMKFQQVSGPVMAKGLEDTAFYNYNRLISLNEVGGEPDRFAMSPEQFHRDVSERHNAWPYAMLATSTHDTKRSEDVRARINVLSEMPREWRAALRRWVGYNRKHKRNVDGQLAPSPNEEYFLYQTLLGFWPFEGDRVTVEERTELVERLKAYMRKAMNEAKVNTSWVRPNEPYQQAVAGFIEAILSPSSNKRFLPDLFALQQVVAHYGALNSLSQTLIKLAGPGVPDVYQGTELWDFSLVDPDNRRPVDYGLRRRLLAQVDRVDGARGAAALLSTLHDGRAKLFVTSRVLRERRDRAELFGEGAYSAVRTSGPHAENLVAFIRSHGDEMVVAIAPRLMSRLGKGGELTIPTGEVWAGTTLLLPDVPLGTTFRSVLTGERVHVRTSDGTTALAAEEALAAFPVAFLVTV